MSDLLTGFLMEAADHAADASSTHTDHLPTDRPVTVVGQGHRTFEVTPGHLDETAREAFTHGQCHAFARALSAATGWPTIGLLTDDCDGQDRMCLDGGGTHCPCRIGHIVCLGPDGTHVDIKGAHPPLRVPDCTDAASLPMTAELWHAIDNATVWREADMPVARSMVAPLLASLTPRPCP
ncbi:hypothetical protein K388_06024 [Streptomyces sp. KhCrAH-43]|uniref:hypothetical protein n=1 Tax=unclassified Streptomyces TaxID=2593676 RepID=UPI000378F6FD|nr:MULTISPECIES: hypothetical protein [unclassified Streptomyces]MYS33682.1 hypothetical protein [Streptomyces sp. SID4920]MYX63725.1 hypothetical protein [Streptomyces sp. SID8373]RAJ52924.1 hypothetical protein K388_06024 [Streptomyces sp. KhCrAH-43]